jgi:hypothetical protein
MKSLMITSVHCICHTLLDPPSNTELPTPNCLNVIMTLTILPPSQPLALPSFTSTLITGPLPSSAALHLALSHLSDSATTKRVSKRSAVIFTPSPDLYETERGPGERLSADEWIENHGLHGEHAHKLTRTHILYANTLSSSRLLNTLH